MLIVYILLAMIKNRNRYGLQLLFFIVLVLIYSGCQTGDAGISEPPYSIPTDLPLLIELSLSHLPFITSDDSKLFVISNNTQMLIQKNQPEFATAVLDSAVSFVESRFTNERRTEVQINLAREYITAGSVSESLALLQQALEQIYDGESVQREEILVQEIITVCFIIGQEAVALLQEAIRRIYAIKDYELRSSLLLEIARKYQEGGEGQRANVLLQQAIPAVSSIEDSLRQAHAYSLLGLRFIMEEDFRSAEIYSAKAMGILREGILFGNTEEEQIFAETLVNLTSTRFANETLNFSNEVATPRLKLEHLLEIARSFYLESRFLQADLVFDRIFSILEEESPPELVISMLLNISRTYFELGDPASAQIYIDAVTNYLPGIADSFQSDRFLLEMALQYARIGNYERAKIRAENITDQSFLFRAYLGVVRIRLDDIEADDSRELSPGIIAESLTLLDAAMSLEMESTILADELFGELAVLFARLGSIEQALNLISQITDPYSKALGLAALYGLTDESAETETIIRSYNWGL